MGTTVLFEKSVSPLICGGLGLRISSLEFRHGLNKTLTLSSFSRIPQRQFESNQTYQLRLSEAAGDCHLLT